MLMNRTSTLLNEKLIISYMTLTLTKNKCNVYYVLCYELSDYYKFQVSYDKIFAINCYDKYQPISNWSMCVPSLFLYQVVH